MNTKIHKHPTTNRRAPLPGTDTGSLRSRTRRRYPHRDRSHHIKTTTNQKAPSRNTGGSNHSHLTLNTNTKSCLPIGQAISHPEVPIGQRKLSIISGFKMANNEQTNLAVISNTNQTPNEPYIIPFDSENGMLIKLDFSQLQLKDNLEQYFHQKLNYGRQLVLSPQLILEELTDGMPTSIKQLMTVNPPTSPTEWLMVDTRLMKTQAPKPEQNSFRQNVPIRPRQNTFVPQNRYFVRPNVQNFNRMRPQHLPNQHAHNFNNRGFRPNHHTHFQHVLPPYPCKICTQQGIPNAYHWKLQCPFNQHQLRQTPFNCDPPLATNAVSQSSENSVGSQQIPNQRQHPPTEASCPTY
ncbi:uncharacterized protein TNCV_4354201 [Trichonephila clavipes]|nr:uncharacterized protein TNCV_4354201 [Trichonephila clavipes]